MVSPVDFYHSGGVTSMISSHLARGNSGDLSVLKTYQQIQERHGSSYPRCEPPWHGINVKDIQN